LTPEGLDALGLADVIASPSSSYPHTTALLRVGNALNVTVVPPEARLPR
jgi:hypothetical protein